jgi:hypothetical protein
MQKLTYHYLLVLLVGSYSYYGYADQLTTLPFIPVRSAHVDALLELIEWTRFPFLLDCGFTADSNIRIEYQHTIEPQQIAQALFGDGLGVGGQSIAFKVTGSRLPTRAKEKDWLADYFGLPTDFQSICCVQPTIRNVIIDFNTQISLEHWMYGAYVHLQAPVVYTQWHLNFMEHVVNRGTQGYVAGYMAPQPVERAQLLNNFTEFITGSAHAQLGDAVSMERLSASKISCKPLTKVCLAALEGVLGWRFIQEDDYFFALNLRGALPTGNKPTGEYLFEPMVGNGGHGELGGGFLFYVNLWRDEYNDQKELGFYFATNVTHLFETAQRRSFDIVGNGNNSRYMLMEHMSPLVQDGLQADDKTPRAQFHTVLTPAANLTTFQVEVSVPWQVDLAMLFNYSYQNWYCRVGYNYWSRQPETITFCDIAGTNRFNGNLWAVKGDAQLFGFKENDAQPVALSATQDKATIHTGLNFIDFNIPHGITNSHIDNPKPATAAGEILLAQPGAGGQIQSSLQPVFTSLADMGVCRSRSYPATHTVFGNIEYLWVDDACAYYLNLGGKVEFAAPSDDTQTNCNGCSAPLQPGIAPCGICIDAARAFSLAQWGLWIQGGISF